MKKRWMSLLLAVMLVFNLAACAEELYENPSVESLQEESFAENEQVAEDGTWAIYWYACGSDLESSGGFCTMDFQEMLNVVLPENVKVIIQTGGTSLWQNELMDASKLQRWEYNTNGLFLVDEEELANMGDPETLVDFWSFAKSNYPADKTVLTFWNHGGGTLSGAAFDENYGNDSIDLGELSYALSQVWNANEAQPPVELIGFDTCLMATIDTINVVKGYAHYLVASEETEPANGWDYTGWLGELAQNPNMDGAALGIQICNTYYDHCNENGTGDAITLSLTDVTKTDELFAAYEAFGQECIRLAVEDGSFYAQFLRDADQTEKYGSNSKEAGFTDMMDLGHLARNTAWILPSAQPVLDALGKCVVYSVNGPYRQEASGLSAFHPYDYEADTLEQFCMYGAGEAFKYFYIYLIMGELPQEGYEYLEKMNLDGMGSYKTFADVDWEDHELILTEDGAVLELGPEAAEILTGINVSLAYRMDDGTILNLGSDDRYVCDWETGIFLDTFDGYWAMLGGIPVFLEVTYASDEYVLYNIPILLNEEAYYLQAAYDYTVGEWLILGASEIMDESGMSSKEMRKLVEGDRIGICWYLYDSETLELDVRVWDEIIYDEDCVLEEGLLMDGIYGLVFSYTDLNGEELSSDMVLYGLEGETIYFAE